MATDGVKIIDSDLAHDSYWGIMDLYDQGAALEIIQKEYPIDKSWYDDFDQEIYITACALAFWEIGALTEKMLEQVRITIDRGTGVKEWIEECDEAAGKARQKELDKLWRKIGKPNLSIRNRKKYRTVTRFHYAAGDVLTFQGDDGLFYCSYLLFITQYRGECVYHFIPFVIKSKQEPQLADILAGSLVGRTIPSSEGFSYGLCANGLLHIQVGEYKSHLEKIGHFELQEQYRKLGQQGGSRNWQQFSQWHQEMEENIKAFRMQRFPVKEMIKND